MAAIVNGYTTLALVKASLSISDTTDDDRINDAITASSRMVDEYCHRQFWTTGTASARIFAATEWEVCCVDDIADTAGTAVTVKTSSAYNTTFDITWASTDFQLEPLNRVVAGLDFAYYKVRAVGNYRFPVSATAAVQVTAKWGWPVVPGAVASATKLQAARMFKRDDSPLGVAGFGDMGAVRVSRFIDSDVAMQLDSYRRLDYLT